MFKNYFKTAWRSLMNRRVFTLLNILGLAVGIASCWIIYRVVSYESEYDAFIPGSERIYQVVSVTGTEKVSKIAAAAAPLYQVMNEVPGIETVVPVYNQWVTSVEVKRGNELFVKQEPDGIIATKSGYFGMLPFMWLAGSPNAIFGDVNDLILTKSRAALYFPDQSPEAILNKTITYFGRDTITRTVKAIVEDLPAPTHFTGKEFVYLKEQVYTSNEWTNTNGNNRLFIQLNPAADPGVVLSAINKLDIRGWKEFEQGKSGTFTRARNYILYPIRDIHFATDISDYFSPARVSKTVIYGLLGIAAFLLALACINYVNMGVAQMTQRGREVGIRKTLGSTDGQLIRQFLLETIITATLACLVAILLSRFGFVLLSGILPEGLQLGSGIKELLLFAACLIALITVFAGIYPALLITKVRTVEVFKGFGFKPGTRFGLQKTLIVFQFVIALIFITGTIIVSSQLRHVLKADMGFDKDGVVLIDIPWQYQRAPEYRGKEAMLLAELHKQTDIEAVLGSAPLSQSYSSSPFEGNLGIDRVQLFKKGIDAGYIDFYRLQLLAGRNAIASDTLSEYILNETAVKALGFSSPEDAIGKMINQLGNPKVPIAGVVKDFHTRNFYTAIEPVAMMNSWDGLLTLNIRLSKNGGWQDAINRIEKSWYKFYPPDTFKYSFYDDAVSAIYKRERQMGTMVTVAAGIMIFISCLGLFGLATLMAWQRTKEIGVRKVLGATVPTIIILFVKDYFRLIIWAVLIATPIVWWAANMWLQGFVYRVEVELWMFVVAGALAIFIAGLTVASRAIKAALANPVKSLRTE